jgi:hypothetical protein
VHFPDEPYVRLYTRKTLTNRQLKWQGRAVLQAMLGGEEFDRAGVFNFRGDPVACVATVTELPEEIVRVGLALLIETETWTVTERAIVWPEYTEAQTCPRSDKLRQSEQRKKRADSAGALAEPAPARPPPESAEPSPVTNGHAESHAVTPSHEPSHAVTPSHAESRRVTPNRADLSRADPNRTEEILSDPPEAEHDGPAPPTDRAAVRTVFAEWQRALGHPTAKLDAKRLALIRRALKLHTPEQLGQAIRGALKDDWLMGRDPKSPRKYDGLETILRDTAQVERLIDLETGKVKPIRRATPNGVSLQPDAGRTGSEHFKGIRV